MTTVVLLIGLVVVGALAAATYRWYRTVVAQEEDDVEVRLIAVTCVGCTTGKIHSD